MNPTQTPDLTVPWWQRRGAQPPMYTPLAPTREQATSEHKHWSTLRIPGRAVRRQLYRAGLYKPRRLYRGKGRQLRPSGSLAPTFSPGPLQRLLTKHLPTIGRWGGDR
jgi:hypothetical protein